jgi:CDGSH-type Zn-finger protein
MQKGNIVKITWGEHEGKAAEIIEVLSEYAVIVKLLNTEETFTISRQDVKRKKMCVCGMSKDYPFCDGSHSSGG